MKADVGSGVVDKRLALMGGGCGTGAEILVDVAELGRDVPPDLGLWNNPIESSWYQEGIFDACVCSSYKEKNILY